MGKIIRILLSALFLSFLFFGGIYLVFGKNLTLIAEESLGVYEHIDDLYTFDLEHVDLTKNRIAILAPKQKVCVTACRYLKDDQVHKIKLPDGKEGYVQGGKYRIVEEHTSQFGFFEKVVCY